MSSASLLFKGFMGINILSVGMALKEFVFDISSNIS